MDCVCNIIMKWLKRRSQFCLQSNESLFINFLLIYMDFGDTK